MYLFSLECRHLAGCGSRKVAALALARYWLIPSATLDRAQKIPPASNRFRKSIFPDVEVGSATSDLLHTQADGEILGTARSQCPSSPTPSLFLCQRLSPATRSRFHPRK